MGALALAVITLASSAHAAAPAKAAAPPAKPPASYPFTFDTLLEDAKRRAAAPYAPQRNSLPAVLDKLSPEQYRSIHFNPDAGIWRSENLPFRLELLRAAYNAAAVTVSTVQNGAATDVVATPAMFQTSGATPAQLKVSLPLSGFRIRSHINSNKVWDEFLVFQGASYFRAVAKNLLYGLSARGLAINTGDPNGEEFPMFTHFWIERPGARANSIVVYALLESQSTTGAYKFTVQPGAETQIEVELTLFPRAEMRVIGIAPLTSMFLFDETNRGRLDDYRP
jgi:periplasmic glucans biosynthesis protein